MKPSITSDRSSIFDQKSMIERTTLNSMQARADRKTKTLRFLQVQAGPHNFGIPIDHVTAVHLRSAVESDSSEELGVLRDSEGELRVTRLCDHLGLPVGDSSRQRVLVIKSGESRNALLVDNLSQVLTASRSDQLSLSPLFGLVGRIDALLTSYDGLPILNLPAILNHSHSRRDQSADVGRTTRLSQAEPQIGPDSTSTGRLLCDCISSETGTFVAWSVRQIRRLGSIEVAGSLPNLPAGIHGWIEYLGEAIPLIDPATMTGCIRTSSPTRMAVLFDPASDQHVAVLLGQTSELKLPCKNDPLEFGSIYESDCINTAFTTPIGTVLCLGFKSLLNQDV